MVLLLVWLFTKQKIWGMAVGCIWSVLFIFALLFWTISLFTSKLKVHEADLYGSYIVDRSKYSGVQSDWQYNHYRFEINKDHTFFFHLMENGKIIKTYKGMISVYNGYSSPRITLHLTKPTFHIIADNPTLYRETWRFYYVFSSMEYGNVFFRKGNWKPL